MSGPIISGPLEPWRATSPPDQRERKNSSKIKGRTAAPAAVAEYPWTWIRFKGNKKKKIPIAAYKKSVSRFAPLKLRDLNSVSGSIGELTLVSTNMKATRQPKPTIKLPKTKGLRQPKLTDSINPTIKPPSPAVATSAPNQSMRPAPALRLSGIRQTEMAITAAASGRLIKNTHRQEACSTNQPPRTGPIAVVIAVKPDHVPIACPPLCAPKDELIIARLPATSSAAPTPCMLLAMMNK